MFCSHTPQHYNLASFLSAVHQQLATKEKKKKKNNVEPIDALLVMPENSPTRSAVFLF